ncbi:hypothetical protein V500_05568 [Pseudogymnoascus sp. VKM F-4518 (FW-2643)]|nr:hypothetical protein V500_05568 [Pseudogymnoascus sp. VKM F-4518 (FW-2643)]
MDSKLDSNLLEEGTTASSKTENDDEDCIREPPDGGSKAWLCVFGAFLLQFSSFGYVNACGIFQFYYSTSLLKSQSASSLAWITTLQVFLMFFLGPPVGLVIDAVGPRPVLIPSSILCVVAIFMLSLCTEYWQVMLAQGVAFGIGTAGVSLPALVLVSQWFSIRRGLATGIVSAGSSCGGIVYPIMVSRLIERNGFASAVRWTGLLVGVCLVVGNICISAPFKPKGFETRQAKNFAAFKSLPCAFFVLGSFFGVLVLFAPLNYLPEMAAQIGSAFGRIIPGAISDKFGVFNTLTIVLLLSGVFTLAIWLPLEIHPSTAGIFVFGLLYGFVSGGVISLAPPCVAALGDGDVANMGAMMGGLCFSIALGALTGLPILGAIKDADGDRFRNVIVFSGCVLILGGFFIGVARVLKFGGALKKRA